LPKIVQTQLNHQHENPLAPWKSIILSTPENVLTALLVVAMLALNPLRGIDGSENRRDTGGDSP
jgi:hypothetical protein